MNKLLVIGLLLISSVSYAQPQGGGWAKNICLIGSNPAANLGTLDVWGYQDATGSYFRTFHRH
jgi:hypothetical protein